MTLLQTSVPNEYSKSTLIPCLPLDSARQLLNSPEHHHFQRLLLPFDSHFLAEPGLDTLLDVTCQEQSDLILLHVGREAELNEEGLFTVLRGLQAQTQQRLPSVTIDSMATNTAVSLLDYAHEHAIDLIVLPSV
jgi:nucleotide-binding universal stress UspA family protein